MCMCECTCYVQNLRLRGFVLCDTTLNISVHVLHIQKDEGIVLRKNVTVSPFVCDTFAFVICPVSVCLSRNSGKCG